MYVGRVRSGLFLFFGTPAYKYYYYIHRNSQSHDTIATPVYVSCCGFTGLCPAASPPPAPPGDR